MANVIKQWYKVFSGDKECRFFKALARHKEYEWRSAASLAKEAKLTVEEVEEIATKYVASGQVLQNKDGSKWGYFERVKPEKPETKSISQENKTKRINSSTGSGGQSATPATAAAAPVAATP